MSTYYNEIDPFAVEWLRALIAADELPHGDVDERSILDVMPEDLNGYDQAHFFAGIGGWALACRLAGIPDDARLWTGSCPCQPFSVAGKRLGESDERHLWPEFARLIGECSPPVVFGEQVAGRKGLGWLDGVFADLEGFGYACGAADLCAAGLSAPHIRQRLYWVAHVATEGLEELREQPAWDQLSPAQRSGSPGGLADSAHANGRTRVTQQQSGTRLGGDRPADNGADGGLGNPCSTRAWRYTRPTSSAKTSGPGERCADGRDCSDRVIASGADGGLPDTSGAERRPSPEGWVHDDNGPDSRREEAAGGPGLRGPDTTVWSDFQLVYCADGKARRLGSGVAPLAYGIPQRVVPILAELQRLGVDPKDAPRIVRHARTSRVGRIRGYGNAIVPQLAAVFLQAALQNQ